MRAGRLQYLGRGFGTSAVYIASAKLGLTLAFVAEQVTVVWPPTGIALCAVLFFGYRIWPFIALGAFIANITTHTPVVTSLGITAGNTLEALAGAYLLKRFVGFRPSLERTKDVFGLVLFAAGISTVLSATIGVLSLCLTETQPWIQFGPLWFVWYLGDAMGNLLVAPLLLTLYTLRFPNRVRYREFAEFVALLTVLVSVNLLVFQRGTPQLPRYAVFPVLIWAALRFGPRTTATATFITAGIAVIETVQGIGPSSSAGINDNLISLQLFMSVAAAASLIMAAAQAERQRSEQRYKSLVLASSHVVWSTNAPGEVIEDLPTWRAFTGQTTEELMGRGWMRMLHPGDVERVGQVWEQSLASKTPHQVEFRVMSAEGTYRFVSGRAVPLVGEDGEVREWVGALTDITEKKRAEQEMQESNRQKDEFLAMLAHELRNPLAPVRSAIEIIRSPKADTGKIAWACEVMERQIHHMGRLLDDLLDVSRITRGRIQLSKQPADFLALVRRSLDAARIVIEKKNLHLETHFPEERLPVSVDVTRLEQVVSNLIGNAVKFTPAGGRISITVEREPESAVLRVMDNGRGIEPELMPRIFDLFTQGDRSLARSEGGLGIGLTLVQHLVRMHAGSVVARSEGPGSGSEFTVRLPLLPIIPSAASTRRSAASETAAPKRVLIIEDNVDAAETLAMMLGIAGHEVHIAHDGLEGLAEFGRINPSVVLLDIGLPGMSGYEIAERMRAIRPANDLRIIALTGYGTDTDRERSKAAGFDHHLVKPVDLADLQKLVGGS